MLKVICLGIIFCMCAFAGSVYGESFKRRYVQLKECYKAISLLQNEVIYNSTPIPEALESIGKKLKDNFSDIVVHVAKKLEEGLYENVFIAFKSEYKEMEEEFYFEKEDESILEDFVKSLGESGVYGQDKIFKLVLENLQINIDEAFEISKKNTKLYKYLGICVGLMIFILLL